MNSLPSLFKYERIKYVGDMKDVKLITELKNKSLRKLARFQSDNDIIGRYQNDLRYNNREDSLPEIKELLDYNPKHIENHERYPVKVMDLLDDELKDNPYIDNFDEITKLDIKRGSLSLTGGYARNILMSTDLGNTDLDLSGDIYTTMKILSMFYKANSEAKNVTSFLTDDNHIHVLPEYMNYYTDLNGKALQYNRDYLMNEIDYEGILRHKFIAPERFDFTVNCGCISSEDGYLYAPPVTLYDIEHKILRSPYSLIEEDCLREIANISTAIRSVRFLHKYDMSMHKTVYKGVITLFAMQKDLETIDDQKLHHALSKLYQDSESLRHSVFKTLQDLGLYETDRFSSFDDYFNYIGSKLDNPRVQSFSVESRFFAY